MEASSRYNIMENKVIAVNRFCKSSDPRSYEKWILRLIFEQTLLDSCQISYKQAFVRNFGSSRIIQFDTSSWLFQIAFVELNPLEYNTSLFVYIYHFYPSAKRGLLKTQQLHIAEGSRRSYNDSGSKWCQFTFSH